MPVKRKRLLASCLAAIGSLSSISDAPGQTWLGFGPGTRLWNDASNWSPQMPVSGDTTKLTFVAPSFFAPNYTSANNLPGTFVLNSITLAVPGNTGGYGIFAPPPPTTTISGNPLEFRVDGVTGAKPEIRQTLGRTIAITNNLHFDDELRIGGPGAGGIAFTGALSGTGSLIKTGGQQFYFGRIDQLTPDATFSGGARIDGGDFFISTSAATLPRFGTGPLTIKNSLVRLQFSGEQWNLDAPTTLIGSVSFGAQYKCVYNFNNGLTLAGVASFTHGGQFGQASTPDVNVPVGQNLILSTAGGGDAGLYVNTRNAALIAGNIVDEHASGPAPQLRLTPYYADILINGAANTYRGGTRIEPGDFHHKVVDVAANSTLGSGPVTVASGAYLKLRSVSNVAPNQQVMLEGNGNLDIRELGNLNAGGLSKVNPASAGVLTVGGIETGLDLTGYSGIFLSGNTNRDYVPADGVYRFAAAGINFPLSGDRSVLVRGSDAGDTYFQSATSSYTGGTTVDGATLWISRPAIGVGDLTLRNFAAAYIGYSSVQNPQPILRDNAKLIVQGGRAFLDIPNSYTGGTYITGGSVEAYANNALGTGDVWINGNAVLRGGFTFPNAFHIAAAPSGLTVFANPAQEPVTIDSLLGRGEVRSQSTSAAISPLHVNKLLSPGENSDAGQLIVDVPLSLEEGSEFHADIHGSTAGSLYDQLFMGSAMEIHDSLLSILLADNFAPSAGQQFMLIDNRRPAQYLVAGQFASLPEGATIDLPTTSFRISYIGGDGNDVVLTALPEPSGTMLISLGILPALRRKRR